MVRPTLMMLFPPAPLLTPGTTAPFCRFRGPENPPRFWPFPLPLPREVLGPPGFLLWPKGFPLPNMPPGLPIPGPGGRTGGEPENRKIEYL